jgi:3',5'-cyclic AMP phosphodiesterase CpdA
MAKIEYPQFAKDRGPGYWLRWGNIVAARRKILRPDYTNQWRYMFGDPLTPDRSVAFSELLEPDRRQSEKFRFLILGDTGEGDKSQYGLLPLLRALKPDFMIINGDVAYPAGRISARDEDDDYVCGFFHPYRDFNCPIWAVPGNHEYYGEGRGREFYNIFCSQVYASRWESYGLRLVQQPSMFWELKEPDRQNDLVVIGIDSGQAANLDGTTKKWWEVWKQSHPGDPTQLDWLSDRLRKAQRDGHSVIIMFHIPGLVREEHDNKTHLKTLHQIIGSYSCVKLVVCGHEHNYQHYSPATFERYLQEKHQASISNPDLQYIVSGGGGAYLTTTAFKSGQYPSKYLYPTPDQWREFAKTAQKIVDELRLSKTFVARGAALFEKAALADADQAKYLNILMVDVDRSSPKTVTTVTPVFLDDIERIYGHLPVDTVVNVADRNPQVDGAAIAACLQDGNHTTENLKFQI